MTPATRSLYLAAGEPPYRCDAAGMCRTCGVAGDGIPFADWVKSTFTDWDKIAPGAIICDACQLAFDEAQPLLTTRMKKDKPQRMRNYSHFVISGAWVPLSKGQKPEMRRLLLSEPAVAVIADSGQKHIIFRARPGWWQFEEQSIRPDPLKLAALIGRITALLDGGFSKAEVANGDYNASRIGAFGLTRWDAIERAIRKDRGTAIFALALFLSQKEDIEDDASGSSGRTAVPVLAGDRERVQTSLLDDYLDAVRGRDQG